MDNNLDESLVIYCNKILPFINDFYSNIEYLLALIIREIRTNDIVYINLNRIWYEYDKENRKWKKFNFNEVLDKLNRFINIFDEIFIKYLNLYTTLNDTNKSRLRNISKKIARSLKNESVSKDRIYEYCCKLFSVSDSI
tara:strand:- start:21826 stop:22242 length:417 start_codon:yes stop_codon:yes gene_type:complete